MAMLPAAKAALKAGFRVTLATKFSSSSLEMDGRPPSLFHGVKENSV
jgi:hypothetical protein